MVKIHVIYEGDLHTVTTHEPSGQMIHTDAPLDHAGKGENFSPTDLVSTALGTCIATVLGIYARRNEIDLRGMRVDVEKKMSDNPPRRIAQLIVHVWIPESIVESEKEKLINVASSCPVHHSLHPSIQTSTTFHWKE